MDFNLDDPLADLVSDNSNDSFFETTTKKQSKPQKQKSESPFKSIESTKATSKTMEDLFGISTSTGTTTSKLAKTESKVSINSSPTATKRPIISRNEPSKSNDLFDDGDIVADLGFDPKKPKGSKSNILDDLLTQIDTSKTSAPKSNIRPMTSGGTSQPRNISRQSTDTTDYSGPGTSIATSLPPARPKTSTGRRQSANSSNDPLGLFANSTSLRDQSFESKPESTKEVSSKTTKPKNINPDWLGLGTSESAQKRSEQKEPAPEIQVIQIHPQPSEVINPIPVMETDYNLKQFSKPNALAIAAVNIEAQNTLNALNQQESQIMMATQMKNQETALLEMQKKQQDLLNQQELKFNELLQKQIMRQNQLEGTIRAQQDRINAHIQMLMTQPSYIPNDSENSGSQKRSQSKKEAQIEKDIDHIIQLEHEVKKLELEKLRLEDLISNINANHEKEVELIETSHKKQIDLLETNLETVQKRLNSEITSLEDFYTKKLTDLELEKQKLTENFEEKIKELKINNTNSLSELKSEYETTVQNLKSDHKNTIESIRESKLMEFALVQDNSSYLQILRNASTNLENVSGNLQTLRDEMYNKIDLEYKEKEEALNQKEKRLNDLERRLKINEESGEREKSRLIELVTTLEIQLQKLSEDSANEQWNLKQKLSSIEIERAAFEREKEFIRNQLIRDEKKLDELKQSQLEEYQRLLHKLEDEKHLLAIEKSKLETAKKLEQNTNVNKSRSEIDIAIKVAQDATKQADIERERYLKLQRDIEFKKREMIGQENELRSKGEELESEIFKVKTNQQKLQQSLQRQKYIEQALNSKIQFLQNQTRVIAERETQLSQERLLISKERIALQEFKKNIEMTKCSLCKIGEKSLNISNMLIGNEGFYHPDFNTGIFGNHKFFNQNIDELFDRDVEDSLKKMEELNKNLGADIPNVDDDNILKINLIQNENNFGGNHSEVLFDPDFSAIEFHSKLMSNKKE